MEKKSGGRRSVGQRPSKPPHKMKSEFLRVRLTPEQARLLARAAELADMSLSSWVVTRLLPIARKEVGQE